jgi:hypothetical protein
MQTTEVTVREQLDEGLRVVLWRAAVLARAGYAVEKALELALEQNVDLHTAVRLAEQGCPQDTALRILL